MDEENLEDRIEEKIEQKIEEKLAGEDSSDSVLEQKIEQKLEEKLSERKKEQVEEKADKKQQKQQQVIDRRKFLKMAGLGAGGLALASQAGAGFVSLSNNTDDNQDLSDVLSNGNSAGSNDIKIPDGQAIVGSSGNERIGIDSTLTRVRYEDGSNGINFNKGTQMQLHTYSGTPFKLRDNNGSFTAVQYDTDSSAGVLRTPNAGLEVSGDHGSTSNSGFQIRYTNPGTILRSRDSSNNYETVSVVGSPLELTSPSGLVDMSQQSADLRLSTGQAIEDGGGNERFALASTATVLKDETGGNIAQAVDYSGTTVFELLSGVDLRIAKDQAIEGGGGNHRLEVNSADTKVKGESGNNAFVANDGSNRREIRANSSGTTYSILRDESGPYNVVNYTASSSAPGTLELSNADLDLVTNRIVGEGTGQEVEMLSKGVSNNATVTVAGNRPAFLMVQDESTNNAGVFLAHISGVAEISDPSSNFGTSANADNINVYYDGSNNLVIQNDSGSSATVKYVHIGLGS